MNQQDTCAVAQQEPVQIPVLTVPEALERLGAALKNMEGAHAAFVSAQQIAQFAHNELELARATLDSAILRTAQGQQE